MVCGSGPARPGAAGRGVGLLPHPGRGCSAGRRAQGTGVALLPVALFTRELQQGRLVQPFALELHRGAYWLTHLQSRTPTAAMQAFGQWLLEQTH